MMYSMTCLQALLRPLRAGETRQALAQRCAPMLPSIPPNLSLMVSQAANPMASETPVPELSGQEEGNAAAEKGSKRKNASTADPKPKKVPKAKGK